MAIHPQPPITLRGRVADFMVFVPATVLLTLGLGLAWTRDPITGAPVVGAVVAGAVICLFVGLAIMPATGSPRQGWSWKKHALYAGGPILACLSLSPQVAKPLVSGDWSLVVTYVGLGLGMAVVLIAVAWIIHGLKRRPNLGAKARG